MKKQHSRKQTRKQPTSKAPNKGVKAFYSGGNLAFGTFVLPSDAYVEKTPQETQYSSTKYIPFLDEENNLLRQLFSIVNTSPTNRAIVLQKLNFCMGDGLNIFPKSNIFKHSVGELSDDQIQKVSDYLERANIADNEHFESIRKKVTRDYVQYGNAYIECIKTSSGFIRQRHLPVSWVRPKKMQENEHVITRYGLSKKWLEYNENPSDLIKYPAFPNFEEIDGQEGERCILHIRDYNPEYLYWGVPDWLAAVYYGEMEYRISKYNNSRFDNGFTASAFIQVFDASMNDEESKEFAKEVSRTYTGTGNNSKILTIVSQEGTEAANVTLLDDKSEGTFLELSKIARENIVTGHRWTQSLVGIGVQGSLGSNQQIRVEYEILKNDVIQPINNVIFTEWINKVLKLQAEISNDDDYNVRLDASLSPPVSLTSELDYNNVITSDEKRELIGYEQLDNQEIEEDDSDDIN